MQPEMPVQLQLLKTACEKFGYSAKLADPHSNNLLEISDGRKTFFANNGLVSIYPSNTHYGSVIVKDKAWTNRLLSQHGFKTIEGDYFFVTQANSDKRSGGKEVKDAIAFANNHGYPLFVKPNDKSKGLGAGIAYNQKDLESMLKDIAKMSHIALVSDVIRHQHEYRIFVSRGTACYAYRKEPAQIIGDGVHTIHQLIDLHNQPLNDKSQINKGSVFISHQLKKKNASLDTVLNDGEELLISATNNIASGAKVVDYTDKFSQATINWVEQIAKLFGLQNSGIDIFSANGIDDPKNFTIIEINGNPHLAGLYNSGKEEKVWSILKDVLDDFFLSEKVSPQTVSQEISFHSTLHDLL